MKKEFIIWFAGFMDGEGSWRIKVHTRGRQGKEYYTTEMKLGNTCKKTIDYIYDNMGGIIFERKRKNPKHKDMWYWQLRSKDKIKKITKELLPYLITKKEIARVISEFPKLDNSNRWDKAIQKKNDKLYLKQKDLRKKSLILNKRGN